MSSNRGFKMPGMDAGGYSESVNLQKVEEKRYDGDEGPFTKQEFFEVYGGYDEWEAAAPKKPPPTRPSIRDSVSLRAVQVERRYDGDEGPFTKEEFFEVYGGLAEWFAAAPQEASASLRDSASLGAASEEKRFDGDEGPFTKQEFFDVYGGYDEWNAAAPKAPSIQSKPAAKDEEKRFDGDEGPFTKQEFFDVYGGYDEWNAAAPKAPSVQAAFPASVQAPIAKAEEKRFDGDEGPFTKHEFFDVYGGYDEWNAAAPPSSKPNNVMPPPAPKAVIPTRPADLPPAMPAPAMPKPAGGMNMLEELKAKQEAKRAAQEAAAAPVEVAPAAAEARKKDTSDVKASSKKADAKPDAPKAATKAVPKETTPSTATKKSVKTTTKEEVSKPKEKYTAPKPKVKPRPVPSAGRAPKADRHVATPAAPEKKERAKKPPAFKVDQLIEGRFEGKAKYFSGKVVKVHEEDNSYDIHYDDGDEEFEVKEVFLRKPLTRKKSATAAAAGEEATTSSSVKAGRGVGARASTGIDRPGESSYMAPSAADVMSGRVVNQSNDDVTGGRKKKGLTGSENWMSNKEYWAKQDEERRNAAKARTEATMAKRREQRAAQNAKMSAMGLHLPSAEEVANRKLRVMAERRVKAVLVLQCCVRGNSARQTFQMVLQARRVAQAQEEAKAAEEAEQARIAEKEATEAAQRQQEEERVAAAAAAAAKADAAAKRKAAAESAALEAQAAAAAAAAAEARALAFLEASKKADNEAAEAEAKIQAGEWTSSGGDASKAIVEFNLQIPLGMTLSEDMIVEEVESGSQAEAGGVQKGWHLLAVNAQPFDDEASFLALIHGMSSAPFEFDTTGTLPPPIPSPSPSPSKATAAPSPLPENGVADLPAVPSHENSTHPPPLSPVRAKEEEEEGEKDPLKQPVVAYLTNAGLLPEVAATIADYVRNEFEADIAQDLAVLDQGDITAVVTSCHLKKVSATKWTNAWKSVQDLAPEVAQAAQGAWEEASEKQRKEEAEQAAVAAKEEEARRMEAEKAAAMRAQEEEASAAAVLLEQERKIKAEAAAEARRQLEAERKADRRAKAAALGLAKKEAADEARKQVLANMTESKANTASPPKDLGVSFKAGSKDLSVNTASSSDSIVRFAPGTGGTPIMSPKNSMKSTDSSEDETQWSDDDDNDLLKALDRAATSGHKSNGRAKWSSDEEA